MKIEVYKIQGPDRIYTSSPFDSNTMLLATTACNLIDKYGRESRQVPWKSYDTVDLWIKVLHLPYPDRVCLDIWADDPDNRVLSLMWKLPYSSGTVIQFVPGAWEQRLISLHNGTVASRNRN